MKFPLPALRTLIIPSGATTGQRIVINGDTGTITMFNSANHITGIWSSTGQSIQVNDDAGTGVIALDATIPAITFNPDTSKFDSHGSIDFSTTTPTRAGLALISPWNSATDNPASIGIVSSGGGTPALLIFTSDDFIANAPIRSQWNGKNKQTASVGPIVPNTTANVVSTTVILPANSVQSDVKITASWNGILSSGTITDVLYDARLLRDGVQIAAQRIIGPTHNQTDRGGTIVFPDIGVSAGSHTYTLNFAHEALSTATDITVICTATTPASIIVEGV